MKYSSCFSLIHSDPCVIISVLLLPLLLLQPLPVLSASAPGVMVTGGRPGLDQQRNFDNNQNRHSSLHGVLLEDDEGLEETKVLTGPDSAEDGQYYDDDPGVTFITEDDIYDDGADSHPTAAARFYGEGSLTRRPGAEQERCPPLPQEPADVKLCQHAKCTSDSQCSQDGSVICCYNGCVHSCQHKVDPPRVFDWLEETELKEVQNLSRRLPTSPSAPGESLRSKQLMSADAAAETIAIPGGCVLTPQQYDHLRLFRQLQHVYSCTCSHGDVLCHVNATKY